MKHFNWVILGAILVGSGFFAASQSYATVWNEASDAGNLPGTADIVAGTGALNQINGVFPGPNDIDMYLIRITDPNSFSATGTGGLPFGPPRIFLFDASGVGVAGYFDSSNTGAALSSTFVTSPGLYYLAYSGFSHPYDSTTLGVVLWQPSPADTERAPDGPAAANPVQDWSPSILPYGPTNYTINLTGAAYVPEPGAATIALLGVMAGVLRRR